MSGLPPPPPPAPPPPPRARPPAGWYDDPARRHEHRYWDGTAWTEHVSDRGAPDRDPIAAPAPATTTETTSGTATGTAAGPPPGPAATPGSTGAAPAALGPAPPSVPVAAGTAWPAGGGGLRSTDGVAGALVVVLWVTVAISVLGALAFVNRAAVVSDILDADSFSELVALGDRADDADTYVGVAVLAMLLASVTVFVLLVIWMWRVAKNAETLGRANPRFGPGWTIGGWFVPVANLVIPVLVMQDLWRGSDPAVPRGDPAWRKASGAALVGWWWAMHLVAALRFAGGEEAATRAELERLRSADRLGAVGMAVAVVAAVLLVRVVRAITRRQAELSAGALTPPA